MKLLSKLLAVIAFLALLSSCVTYKRCNAKFPPQASVIIKDSIITKDTVIYRDKIVLFAIKGDTVFAEKKVPITVDISPVWAQNEYATASAWVQDSKLKLQLIQKDQVIKIIIDSAYKESKYWKEKYTNEKQVITLPAPPPEKFVPKFIKFLAWVGGVFLLGVILYVAYKVFKPKISFLG